MSDIVRNPALPITASHTTAAVTNADTFSAAFFNPGLWKGARFYVKRTADTGTSTLDVYLQSENPMIAGDWQDVTGKIIAQFADGVTNTYIGEVLPGVTAQDSSIDATVTAGLDPAGGTGGKVDQTSASLPWHWRLRYRHGGTTVTNTFSVNAEMLR